MFYDIPKSIQQIAYSEKAGTLGKVAFDKMLSF